MKVLITGGAGFVGSHLAEALLARGDTVHVLDNLSTGAMDNIGHLKGRERFHYLIDTVMNEGVVAEMIDRVDVVYHLAAAVGVKLIVESPVNTIETNVHGTEMVLKVASKKKKKVLIASTSEVYGKSEQVPFREDADLSWGPPPRAAGATPAARPSTSSSPSPTGRRSTSRWWCSACSTPWGRGRPDATGWSSPTS